MADVLRFWVARGADGFRIDALRQTIKDDRWRDNPPNPAWREGEDPYHALLPEFTTDRPEVPDVVRQLRATVDEAAADGRQPVLIGELYLPVERLMPITPGARPAGELPPAHDALGGRGHRGARRRV